MPIERLAIVFLGLKDRTKQRGKSAETFHCSKCKKNGHAEREKCWRQLSVLGLPLFTWKRRYVFKCEHCRSVVQEKRASFLQSALWLIN